MSKKSTIKIPKRIAGVKIPKSIRKGPIGDFLHSSGGQVVLAEALLAVGALYGARRWDAETPAGHLLRHPLDGVRSRLEESGLGTGRLSSTRDRLARAFQAGIHAFRAELHGADGTGAEQSPEADVDSNKTRQSNASPH